MAVTNEQAQRIAALRASWGQNAQQQEQRQEPQEQQSELMQRIAAYREKQAQEQQAQPVQVQQAPVQAQPNPAAASFFTNIGSQAVQPQSGLDMLKSAQLPVTGEMEQLKINSDALNNTQRKAARQQAMQSPAKEADWGKVAQGALYKGADQFVDGLANSLDWVVGTLTKGALGLTQEEYESLNTPTTAFKNWLAKEADKNTKYFADAAGDNKAAQLVDQYGTATVAALPQAAMALMTGGASAAASSGSLAASSASGLGATVNSAIQGMAKNPQYWLSFLTTAGNDYESARADGANDLAATSYALINGLTSAAVEMGGGIEALPGNLKKGGGKAVLEWVKSALDEGKEEVVQGAIQRGLENLVYGKNNPVFSATDENAIVNPTTMAQEFGGGAVVGGLLGGGQALVQGGLNAVTGRGQVNTQSATTQADTAALNAQNEQQSAEADNIGQNVLDLVNKAVNGKEKTASEETAEPILSSKERKGETVGLIQNLKANIPELAGMPSVATTSANAFRNAQGSTMAEKAKTLFKNIMGVVSRPGFGQVDIDTRSIKDDLSHGVGPAKTAVIPTIPYVIKQGKQIDFQEKWKGRPYDGYVFAAPVEMDGEPVYVAAIVKRTSKNRFYLHEVVDSNGNIIKINDGIETNPTGLVTESDTGISTPSSNTQIPQTEPVVKGEPVEGGLGAANAGFAGETLDYEDYKQAAAPNPVSGTYDVSPEQIINLAEQQGRDVETIPVKAPDYEQTGALNSKRAQSILNSPTTPDSMAENMKNAIASGAFEYIPYSDNEAVARAQREVKHYGWEESLGKYRANVESGKSSKDITVMGITLYNNAVTAGDYYGALEIAALMAQNSVNTAQAMQAMRILNKIGPSAELYGIQQSIERMRAEFNDKSGVDIKVDPELYKKYLKATDDAGRREAITEMQKQIAAQIPATLGDKWTALRYMNMLGNFKTQLRNVLGNTAMTGLRAAKDTTAATLEAMVNAIPGVETERQKSIHVGKEWMKAAAADFTKFENVVLGSAKYNDSFPGGDFAQGVNDQRRIFKTGILEGYRKATSWAMEKGDVIFSRHDYARALAGYLKANGVEVGAFLENNVDPELLERARLYAVKEAQEATFRDNSWLANKMVRIGRNPIAQGLLPFRKTPANVLLRAEEYSPLGLINTAVMSAKKAAGNNEITGGDIINSLSKNVVGTGLFGLGILLRNMGWLRGGSDDEDYSADTIMGYQDYALRIPGVGTYTMDWVAPASLVMFTGAQLADLMLDGDVDMADVEKALTSLADPMISMSFMSGVEDALESIKFSDNTLIQIAAQLGLNYLLQGVTNTMFGQLERTTEENRMTYYTEDNGLPEWLQKSISKASAKMPGWDYQQTEYLDAFGNKESSGGIGQRVLENFISPGYWSPTQEDDKMRSALYDIHEELGKDVFPDYKAPSSVTENKQTVELSQAEKEKFQSTRGQLFEDGADSFAESDIFDLLTQEARADVFTDMREMATAKAKSEALEAHGVEEEIGEAEQARRDLDTAEYISYLIYKNAFKEATSEDASPEAAAVFESLMQDYGSVSEDARKVLEEFVDSFNKVQSAMTDAGLTLSEYQDLKELHDGIDNVNDFAAALDQGKGAASGITGKQKEWAKDNLTYGNWIPTPADESRYTSLTTDYGMSSEAAQTVITDISKLEPQAGKDSVVLWQQYDAINKTDLSEQEKLKAFQAYTSSEKAFEKIVRAYSAGWSLEQITAYKRLGSAFAKVAEMRSACELVGLSKSEFNSLHSYLG